MIVTKITRRRVIHRKPYGNRLRRHRTVLYEYGGDHPDLLFLAVLLSLLCIALH